MQFTAVVVGSNDQAKAKAIVVRPIREVVTQPLKLGGLICKPADSPLFGLNDLLGQCSQS